MKNLQQVAILLLKNNIEFSYTRRIIKVTDCAFSCFAYAAYHLDTGKLIFMDERQTTEITQEQVKQYFL
jgi:hypothetical protein